MKLKIADLKRKDKTEALGKDFHLFVGATNVKQVSEGDSPRVVVISGYANKYLDESGAIVVDRSNESVLPQGYDLVDFMKNPILLGYHNSTSPIGKVICIEARADGLYIEAEVHEAMNSEIFYGVTNGILKTFSIGFRLEDYLESDGIYFLTRTKLFEISIVSVPDNQDSIFTTLTQSPCASGTCLLGSKALPTAMTAEAKATAATMAWKLVDKAEIKEALSADPKESLIKEMYLFGSADSVETWKMPHHVLKDGHLLLNRGGLQSALSALKSRDVTSDTLVELKAAALHLQAHFVELKEDDDGDTEKDLASVSEFLKDLEEDPKEEDPKEEDPKEEDPTEEDPKEEDPTEEDPTEEDPKEEDPKVTLANVLEFIQNSEGTDEGVDALLRIYGAAENTVNTLLGTTEEE